jgi:hypothetical protein
MKSMYRFLGLGLLLTLLLTPTLAQRPRTVNEPEKAAQTTNPVPQGVTVKYEGGIFGYNKKIDGTLSFDDMNKRLLFRNKEQKEVFSIPYESIVSAFADTQSKRPTAASVLGSASIYTFPARFIKKKYRYLTLQYNDPDTRINGTTSFKMQNKEILASVLNTLANKAELTQRGEIYVRPKSSTAAGQQSSPE